MHTGSPEPLSTRRASLLRDVPCVRDLRKGRLGFTLILRIYFGDCRKSQAGQGNL